jgi:hypothetical protein
MYARKGQARMPDEYRMFLTMKVMGWDYYTYLRQPHDLIILIEEFIKLEKNGTN